MNKYMICMVFLVVMPAKIGAMDTEFEFTEGSLGCIFKNQKYSFLPEGVLAQSTGDLCQVLLKPLGSCRGIIKRDEPAFEDFQSQELLKASAKIAIYMADGVVTDAASEVDCVAYSDWLNSTKSEAEWMSKQCARIGKIASCGFIICGAGTASLIKSRQADPKAMMAAGATTVGCGLVAGIGYFLSRFFKLTAQECCKASEGLENQTCKKYIQSVYRGGKGIDNKVIDQILRVQERFLQKSNKQNEAAAVEYYETFRTTKFFTPEQ